MKPFLGIGTGRCGTVSLVKIINACKGVSVRHEDSSCACFWYQRNLSMFYYFKERVMLNRKKIVGDVAFYWLPHVEKLRKMIDLNVVCIHRNKEDTVNSFLRLYGNNTRLRLKDCPVLKGIPNSLYYRNLIWWHKFPIIEGETPKECWEKYWEMYEVESRKIENCYHINIEDLNNDKKLNKLFNYLGIKKENRVFIENRHYNKKIRVNN